MTLDDVNQYINPVLLGIAFAFSLAMWAFESRPPVRFWFILWFGGAAVFAVHYVDARFAFGQALGVSFLLPIATTVALALTLMLGNKKWTWLMLPLLICYLGFNVFRQYLLPLDVLATSVVIIGMMFGVWWLTGFAGRFTP